MAHFVIRQAHRVQAVKMKWRRHHPFIRRLIEKRDRAWRKRVRARRRRLRWILTIAVVISAVVILSAVL